MIETKTIADSINPHGSRLFTVLTRYPRFIHAEHIRHRAFSFSVSSNRAIPVTKNLEEVRSDELRAAPIWWGKEQKGMASGEELDDTPIHVWPFEEPDGPHPSSKYLAKRTWDAAAEAAADYAFQLHMRGAHKSIVNRILEPFLHVNVLCSGTTDGWMNFFGLRLDRAAQPEIRALAEAIWREWNEHEPTRLEPGQWHLPFAEASYAPYVNQDHQAVKVSVARCARLSYMSFETGKRSTIEEDLALYDRLVGGSPIHASPAEHQATPDIHVSGLPAGKYDWDYWRNPHEAGNLGPGWRQYRKMLPNEAIAPLPAAYR